MNEEPVDLAAERAGIARVRAARVGEARRKARDVLDRGRPFAVTGRDHAVDLGHGVLPVEERDDVEGGDGKEGDLLREARRVTEPYQPLTILLDGKGFERPETRAIRAVHHRSTPRGTSELPPRKSAPRR